MYGIGHPFLDRTVIQPYLDAHPFPLLFVTVSGAHLYGFDSPDSDYDLRGCHITPVKQVIRMSPPDETHEVMDKGGAVDVDLVTHDVKKFLSLLLKNNGYVLEQVCSPLVIHSTPDFEELRALAPMCVTRQHKHHFLRFGQNQWEMVVKNGKPTVKGLLYTYRVLLAGIYLMRTGQVQSNLRTLNAEFRYPAIDDLIAAKVSGTEKTIVAQQDVEKHEPIFQRLCAELELARERSGLPDEPRCRAQLEELIVRVRMKHVE
jgi:predicted nucleotidyltransferase